VRSGNSAARWKNRQESARIHRRVASTLPSEAADLGNRPEVEEALGFGDPETLEPARQRDEMVGPPDPPPPSIVVAPGQVWTWQEPNGRWREMLIERVSPPQVGRRAWGHHPQGRKRIQVLVSTLEKGLHGARLLRTIENYEHTPGPATRGVGGARR
jgi:hypothetical protein